MTTLVCRSPGRNSSTAARPVAARLAHIGVNQPRAQLVFSTERRAACSSGRAPRTQPPRSKRKGRRSGRAGAAQDQGRLDARALAGAQHGFSRPVDAIEARANICSIEAMEKFLADAEELIAPAAPRASKRNPKRESRPGVPVSSFPAYVAERGGYRGVGIVRPRNRAFMPGEGPELHCVHALSLPLLLRRGESLRR